MYNQINVAFVNEKQRLLLIFQRGFGFDFVLSDLHLMGLSKVPTRTDIDLVLLARIIDIIFILANYVELSLVCLPSIVN